MLRTQKIKEKERRKAALKEKALRKAAMPLLPEVKVSGIGTFTPPNLNSES